MCGQWAERSRASAAWPPRKLGESLRRVAQILNKAKWPPALRSGGVLPLIDEAAVHDRGGQHPPQRRHAPVAAEGWLRAWRQRKTSEQDAESTEH